MEQQRDALRRQVLAEIERLQALEAQNPKETYRSWHAQAVQRELARQQYWIRATYPKYEHFFANGSDLSPQSIRPILLEVVEEWQADLFRLARLTWSLPFTRGYGRRLRFLIMDASNEKLIGILALQSPPLDFPVRDRLFAYAPGRKVELVNQTMDIFTLGALPPYNRLLGGKLVALAAVSDEVRLAYERKYTGRLTQLEQRALPARLVALTTTSAFGRSSLYNRLSYRGQVIAYSIGYTEGYGSFHFAPLYPTLCAFLEEQGRYHSGGFGTGPRITWQNVTRALDALGLPRQLLRHGIKREAFLFPLISNLQAYFEGQDSEPHYYQRPFAELAAWWRERWLLGRAARVDGWHRWNRQEILAMLTTVERSAKHGTADSPI
ncbi:MAG: DUF4338 domain-containing protein [Thermogemmatispora sp.]|nr:MULTISPECIES: Druantia anti-phage system protein DruA [Thermogemmatispora]MBX5457951.1 DUF4338 domain-containing protein [Thermogemmatispora sp.]